MWVYLACKPIKPAPARNRLLWGQREHRHHTDTCPKQTCYQKTKPLPSCFLNVKIPHFQIIFKVLVTLERLDKCQHGAQVADPNILFFFLRPKSDLSPAHITILFIFRKGLSKILTWKMWRFFFFLLSAS